MMCEIDMQPIEAQTPEQTNRIIAAYREWQEMEAESERYVEYHQEFIDYGAIGAP